MASKYVAEQHANLHIIHRRGDGQTKKSYYLPYKVKLVLYPKVWQWKNLSRKAGTRTQRCKQRAKERRKQTADNPNQRLSQYPAWRKSYALFFYTTKTETMKFSMLAIAATALSAGVEGFSASRNFAVRKVSSMFLDDMWGGFCAFVVRAIRSINWG